LYRGETTAQITPYTGMGYGTAIGLVAAGALATRVTISPSRVLLIDLGTGAGALLGAAAGSPLIFQNATESNTRGWLTTTISGSLLGGIAAWLLTRDSGSSQAATKLPALPVAGVIGASPTARGSVPVFGLGVCGVY
jgi:hypothetical protein